MLKKEKKGHLGRDISMEITTIFARDRSEWPPFCLIQVKLAEVAGDEDALTRTARGELSPAEMLTFQGFRFARRRREWLAGRLAVKEAVRTLAAHPHRARAEVVIGVDNRGKPLLIPATAEDRGLHIAISHSGDTALGLASSVPCALDFQEIRASLARVESKFAMEDEVRRIQPCHPDRLSTLGLLWAGKEALRKHVAVWPLLGFLEAGLVEVVGQGKGFFLSFQALPHKRELPVPLPGVFVGLYDQNALALLFDKSKSAGQ